MKPGGQLIFLLSIPAGENLEVDFFGGEPLMCWETVRELSPMPGARAECGKFPLYPTTNGLQ